MTAPARAPLDRVTSIKVKLGLLVAVSVAVAAVLGTLSGHDGVPPWLAIPVTIALALGVTQLLATGMTSPLRQMTGATHRMARGDYTVRVVDTSSDEVGELARAFNAMAADLSDVDRQRRELIGTVSHELRTPLAGLIGVLENLEDGVVPADPDGLRTAVRQAERLSSLVADLLDLSRLDAGVLTLADDQIPIAAFVAAAVDEAESLGRPVPFRVRVEPADLTVRGDRARLHQLVSNLLDNASRHSPTGIPVTVSVVGDAVTGGWSLEVANAGPSIEPADRDRIFERFGRLSDPAGGGTGLGLAIARWVTDLHGGRIAVLDPVRGETGVRFRAEFPGPPDGAAPSAAPSPRPDSAMEAPMSTPTLTTPAGAPPAPPASDDLSRGLWPAGDPPVRPDLLVGSVLVGVLAGLILPFEVPGIGAVVVLLAGGGLVGWAARRPLGWFTIACAALAVPLAAMLMLRDAAWIAILCVLAAVVLCVAGSARARSLAGIVLSGVLWPLSALHGLPWLGGTLRSFTGTGRWIAVLRTLLLSVVGVLVFGLLFASADALFARWAQAVLPDLHLDGAVLRIFVGVAVGGVVLGTCYFALNPPSPDRDGRPRRPVQQRYEWLAPVLLVDMVFLLFLVAQAAATFGGHGYLQRTTGLTYAAYVHQGFGQLTVATLLTLLVVWGAAHKAAVESPADRLWLRGSLGLLCVLTLVVVGSALRRMDLYQQAYGFSRLRLLVDVFEGWLGLVVLGVLVAGIRLRGRWLPRAALLTGATALLALGLSNPDAWIARHNIERYQDTGKVDWGYLQGLSADAVPALAGLSGHDRACALSGRQIDPDDVLSWNLGRSRARSELSVPSHPQPTVRCASASGN